jgi:NAD(P)-dependent dehydrogenase (short-subunit alcohol dehydrogenase family)
VRARHGFVNLLVNNAGVAFGLSQPRKPHHGDIRVLQDALWTDAAPADFARSFEANVTGAYYCTVAFLDLLHRGNEHAPHAGVTSQVITVSSISAFRRDEHVYSIPYTLSKAASVHMGKLFTNILAEWKIRSNVIAPGIFPSGQLCPVALYAGTDEMKHRAVNASVPQI